MSDNEFLPHTTEGLHDIEVLYDVRIPTTNSQITLSADVHRPLGTGPVPALVTLQPYRKDFIAGSAHNAQARWFAERGYASLLVDLAGTGSSDGARRPEFDPGEGDDAVAAIEWAAAQPWCNGNIGMWGASYGAITTMRAASRRPPQLGAIIPLVHGLDPGRDTIHPDGARGDLHALAGRGTSMLVQQLLPPLFKHMSVEEQRRWQRRLHDTEPIFMDFARHGPNDPVWRDRAIDGESIVAPALCVGGWRDAFPDALTRAYERMRGPKKLLVGPWGHVLPHHSVLEPIDFPSIALRWWDHWLRGMDNGVMDEPPVTLYLEGHNPRWRCFESWPLVTKELALHTDTDTRLTTTTSSTSPITRSIAQFHPDPTVGALRGLPGLGMGEACIPQDQHDDDVRSLSATSDPLPNDLTVGGRPEVLVILACDQDGKIGDVTRLVARLTEVDSEGRSRLITTGVLCPEPTSQKHRIVLRPIAYRVPAGRRLRVALGDADFPRLTPVPHSSGFQIARIELSIPSITDDAGAPADIPSVAVSDTNAPVAGATSATTWTITRDPINDSIEVALGSHNPGMVTTHGHKYETHTDLRAAVRRTAPEAALTNGSHTTMVEMGTGETVKVAATIQCTHTTLHAHGDVVVNDKTVFSRTWETILVPESRNQGKRTRQ